MPEIRGRAKRQFSLRTLLLGTAVVGLLLCWQVHRQSIAKQEYRDGFADGVLFAATNPDDLFCMVCTPASGHQAAGFDAGRDLLLEAFEAHGVEEPLTGARLSLAAAVVASHEELDEGLRRFVLGRLRQVEPIETAAD